MHEVHVWTGLLDCVTKVKALFINLVHRFLADAREAPRGLCSSRSLPLAVSALAEIIRFISHKKNTTKDKYD